MEQVLNANPIKWPNTLKQFVGKLLTNCLSVFGLFVVRLSYVCMLLVEIYQKCVQLFRSSRLEVFCKKDVLRNFTKFTGIHLCQSLFLNKVKKKDLAQVFSCEFCKISKSTFPYRTPPVTASKHSHVGGTFSLEISKS